MTAYISAPYPSNHVTLVLPSPKFTDAKTPENSVDIKRSMNGAEIYTYVNQSTRQTLTLPFILTRPKLLELKEFFRIYYRAKVLIRLHDDSHWLGNLLSTPLISSQLDRGGVEVTLEFSASPYFPPVL